MDFVKIVVFSVNLLYDSFDLNNEKNTSIISANHRKKVLLSTILIAFSLFLSLDP